MVTIFKIYFTTNSGYTKAIPIMTNAMNDAT